MAFASSDDNKHPQEDVQISEAPSAVQPGEEEASQPLPDTDEIADLKDQLLRALADAENIRKRALKEQEDARKYAVTSFAKEMLSVLDNLGRALDSVPSDQATSSDMLKNLVSGITMTQQAMVSACERHGIRKVEALGASFDPHLHQAMNEVEGPQEQVGKVVHVMQEGYQIHDRLLRPALVSVGKAQASKGGALEQDSPPATS